MEIKHSWKYLDINFVLFKRYGEPKGMTSGVYGGLLRIFAFYFSIPITSKISLVMNLVLTTEWFAFQIGKE